MPNPVVIDTNVLALANGKATHRSISDTLVAAEWLSGVLGSERIAFDTAGAVLREYLNYASLSGQPGPGDVFISELLRRSLIDYIDIGETQVGIDSNVPESLRDFDANDRKWIALFVIGRAKYIANATDSDYAERSHDFELSGIAVLELLGV